MLGNERQRSIEHTGSRHQGGTGYRGKNGIVTRAALGPRGDHQG